jgi:TatD DNase family protein
MIDTHCHLDAAAFDADRLQVLERARAVGVQTLVLPGVEAANFEAVRTLAHQHHLAYALGIHPLRVDAASEHDLKTLEAALQMHQADPHLVAVGEIGLDQFVPDLNQAKATYFLAAQLSLAKRFHLPLILHLRRSAQALLKALASHEEGGIVHAFNGSFEEAKRFIARGFKLGFGGAMTSERALNIRRLAEQLPESALVLETDAPDMAPSWQRSTSIGWVRNEPAQLPQIAATLAHLRGQNLQQTLQICTHNALVALPRLHYFFKQ